MENQDQMTKDQVATLLNYWERIIQNLGAAVERTVQEVAIEKQNVKLMRDALAQVLIWVDPASVPEDDLNRWRNMAGITTKTIKDLSSPQEEIIQ